MSNRRSPLNLAVVGAALASGTLFLLGTGLHPVPWLTWLAPVPVLVVAPLVGRWTAVGVAGVAYLLGLSGEARYLLVALETPPPVVAVLLLVTTTIFVGVVALFRGLAVRGRWWWAVVAVPAAWVSAEYTFAVLTPYGANWSLAPTQSDLTPVIQIASVTGAGGVTFLVTGTAAALAVGTLTAVRRPRLAASVVAAAALVLGSSLAFGTARLDETSGVTVRVAVVAAPGPGYQPEVGTPEGRRLIAADLAWLRSPALGSARIVVFPETDVEVREAHLARLEASFARVAGRQGVTVVLGVARMRDDGRHNTALVFPADGSAPAVYDKQHPIVGQESHTVPGHRLLLLGSYGDRVGVAVCADLAHPGLARAYALAGARLMTVPALDFTVDAWSQSRVQILRGVESGFATARAARDGNLTIADAQGRIVAERPARGDGTVALVADAPLGPGATAYARLGDWFSWLCLLLTFVTLLVLLPGRGRPRDVRVPDGRTCESVSPARAR